MKKVTVSIVVITYYCPSIYDCLKLLLDQIGPDDEIIIVDDHSPDEYYQHLYKFCNTNGILLLRSKKHGNRAHNRNVGANRAHNDVLVFIDADMMLLETSIPAIKAAYATTSPVAYIGMRSAGRYDPLTMSIFAGINIPEMRKQGVQLEHLTELPSIRDSRINSMTFMDNLPEQKYYWIYYYSCCCAVSRTIFVSLGGFNEEYVGWGVEDIDLGFRISQVGKITFLRNFCGVHIPHDRNILYAEQDNCRNLKRMLQKNQRFDIEVVSAYRVSAFHLEQIKKALDKMRMLQLPLLNQEVKQNIIYIDCISMSAPDGNMTLYDSKGKRTVYHLIGISTFFADKSVSTVVISSNIVLYPVCIICGILQEALRVGETVVLRGSLPDYRLDWSGFPNLTLLQPQKRNEYRIRDLAEFQLHKNSDREEYLVSSDYLVLEINKNVPVRLPIHKFNKTTISQTYCVINLTSGTGYQLLLKQLELEFNIKFVGVYSAQKTGKLCEFPPHMGDLLRLHTPVLLVVEDLKIFCLDFVDRNAQRKHGNIIIDLLGNFLQL